MYKYLIVDDEYVELEALEYILQNSDLHIASIETATSGKKAIEKAQNYFPDFILMDIKMPGISGIDAAKIIKDTCQNCCIIFLSAFNNFDFAQEAIHLGASDYLIKPISNEQLINTLKKHILFLEKQEKTFDQQNDIHLKFQQINHFFETEFIHYLLFSDIKKEQILEYLHFLNLEPHHLRTLILRFDSSTLNSLTSFQQNMLKRRSIKLVKNYFNDLHIHLLASDHHNTLHILLLFDSAYNDSILLDKLNHLQNQLENKLLFQSQLVISTNFTDLEDIKSNFICCKTELISSIKPLALVSKHHPLNVSTKFDYLHEAKLHESVLSGNTALTLQLLQSFTHYIDMQALSFSEKRLLIFGLLNHLIKSIIETHSVQAKTLNDLLLKALSDLSSSTQLCDAFSTLETIIHSVLNILSQSKTSESSSVAKVCEFIDTHYHEDITLTAMAAYANLNSQYLSKLFKEETGRTFSDYLTEQRIHQSKQLLTKTTFNIQEISRLVGYNDPNYFTRTFKKYELVSPTMYRDHLE
jgi:two-component system response regulator YesN